MGHFSELVENLRAFTPQERRNIAIYITGIMIYKFGLEAFNGSIIALATNRYDYEAIQSGTPSRTFERVGLLTGLNQAFQCFGSILIGPLVKRYPTKNVLSCAILIFGVCSALLLIIDAATGGTFMPASYRDNPRKNEWPYYGKYNTDAIIPVYCVSGIVYGMVELIRRVIPRDIVGGHVQKLKKMDSLVHIFYEISGTAGAFVTGLVIIPQLGNNMSFIVTPICFALAAFAWFFISELDFRRAQAQTQKQKHNNNNNKTSYFRAACSGLFLFAESVWVGARILFTSRKFVWLVPGYSVALYAHRYLENNIAPQIARRYLGNSAWAQIMVGGSNLGELLGAFSVLLFTNAVQTPMPWLRLDALMLLIVWYVPFWYPPAGDVGQAWIVAATLCPVAYGWASGDVSLAAYIQASLARIESQNKNVSALGAVMAFLYSFYIVTYAVAGTLLGRYLDGVYNKSGGTNGGEVRSGLLFTAGVQMSIISVLVFASTFVPRGAFAFNPKLISDEVLDDDDHIEIEEQRPRPDDGNRDRGDDGFKKSQSYCGSEDGSEPRVEKRIAEML
ncbi:major facilitator superfamily domain-containing protein [Chaetomium strumarium]|uniref:Major facilitator superfamily domain-containing protein n=1 Tax=Chaetomium strumarium TaxID=1170767 RepID=A0AAJ0GPL1_9PEZI|nr:major facilitator superfamily domain-containing protein [Chaetomium strumarium]